MKQAQQKPDPWTEYRACAECDSPDELEHKSVGDEWWRYCPECQSIEGATRYMWRNDETGELTGVMPKGEM